MKFSLFVSIVFAFSWSAGSAQLAFAQTVIEHTAELDEDEFVAVFKFQNTGDETIEVMKPSSSCGCTVPNLEKRSYAPGEEGEIAAVFTYGTRSGKQHKTVTVPTTNGVHKLEISVDIPLRYALDVRLLHWKKNEEMEPKTATFQFHVDLPVSLISHTVNEEFYQLDYGISPDGGTHTVKIRPTADSPTRITRTDWQFKSASGKTYEIPLYMRVY